MPTASTGTIRIAVGMSGHPDAGHAAAQTCGQVAEAIGPGSVDLGLAFLSRHHAESAGAIAARLRRELKIDCLIGVSAEAVIGGRHELERTPGLSLMAARLPGVSLHPYTGDRLGPIEDTPDGLGRLGAAFGADTDLRASFIFADPFSVPISGLLPLMCRARAGGQAGAIIGGMASGGAKSGEHVLILDDVVQHTGLVGVSLRGAVKVDAAVSQGCRGIGPSLLITKARKNLVLQLGGRPALRVVREVLEDLPDDDKKLLDRGLFMGLVINEYKERFGRDDFLIRNVVGVDERVEAIALNTLVRVGQTARFHLRDARTADEDLALLLDAQQLREPPLGALLITCASRGSRLFDRPHHDAGAVARAFGPALSGEELARGGEPISSARSPLPLAGFFASAEVAPVGPDSYVHGQAACLALFRSPSAP
jgi:small ligand-binding sensory domain FIST